MLSLSFCPAALAAGRLDLGHDALGRFLQLALALLRVLCNQHQLVLGCGDIVGLDALLAGFQDGLPDYLDAIGRRRAYSEPALQLDFLYLDALLRHARE